MDDEKNTDGFKINIDWDGTMPDDWQPDQEFTDSIRGEAFSVTIENKTTVWDWVDWMQKRIRKIRRLGRWN